MTFKTSEKTSEMPICKRCGRKLKNPKWREIGMGPTCYRKTLKENKHKKLFSTLQDR